MPATNSVLWSAALIERGTRLPSMSTLRTGNWRVCSQALTFSADSPWSMNTEFTPGRFD